MVADPWCRWWAVLVFLLAFGYVQFQGLNGGRQNFKKQPGYCRLSPHRRKEFSTQDADYRLFVFILNFQLPLKKEEELHFISTQSSLQIDARHSSQVYIICPGVFSDSFCWGLAQAVDTQHLHLGCMKGDLMLLCTKGVLNQPFIPSFQPSAPLSFC